MDDVKQLVPLWVETRNPGSSAPIFFNTFQYGLWIRELLKEVNELEEGRESADEGKRAISFHQMTMFKGKSIRVQRKRAFGTCNKGQSIPSIYRDNMGEQSKLFWRIKNEPEGALKQQGYVGMVIYWWRTHGRLIRWGEPTGFCWVIKLQQKRNDSPRASWALRPELKNVISVNDIGKKFWKYCLLLVDPCARIYVTAKECKMLSKLWRFIGYEVCPKHLSYCNGGNVLKKASRKRIAR